MNRSIVFLSTIHEADDKRVFHKEARTLADAGYSVTHVAPGPAPCDEPREGIRIIIYPRAIGPFARVRNARRLLATSKHLRADAWHCNEPDSWVVGLWLRWRSGGVVVFDVHELYLSRLETRRMPRAVRRPAAWLLGLAFRNLARRTDALVLAKQSVARDFAGTPTLQILVRNFAPRRLDPGQRRAAAGVRQPLSCVHLGQISRVRGWPQLIEAMSMTRHGAVSTEIIGVFTDGSEAAFRAAVERATLQDRVRFTGWVPIGDAIRRAHAADVGLVLFQPGIENHTFAFPHKLFDYMLAGLPVIAPSFAVEVATIVTEADAGILVDVTSPREIAQAMDRLADNPVERQRLGENGRRAVLERYNWERESKGLLSLYESLLKVDGR